MTQGERISQAIKKFQRFNSWLMYIVVFALCTSFIVDSLNPIIIKLLGFRLFPFQKELVEELMIVVIWLPFAYVLIGPGHIVTDIFRIRMGRRMGFAADMLIGVAVLVAGGVAFLASLSGSAHAIQFQAVKMGEAPFSLIPFYITINISFFLFVIANILLMLKRIYAFRESGTKPAQNRPVASGERLV